MADILSQDEVDLLLNAVSDGDVEEEDSYSDAPEAPNLTTYDFRRPERVSKEQLKGLQSLFEAFAREVSIVFPPFLRTVMRVDLTSIDQLTYDEFILSVARPTSLVVIDMAPLDGNAVMEMNPAMIFPIVDRVLGGKGMTLSEPRELTEIEDRIVQRIVLMLLDCLKRSWEQLVEFDLSIEQQESDPLIVQIVAGSEMVIMIGYEVHIGEAVGSMNMCVPLMVLNPILDQISRQMTIRRTMTSEMSRAIHGVLRDLIKHCKVPVDAILGHATLPLSDVINLQVGDVVPLSTGVNQDIEVRVGGQPTFTARPGRIGEASAVQVTSIVRKEEDDED